MCVHSPVLGSIARAVPYLFAPADSRQRMRERVELLRGDAQQLIDLVNTLPSSADTGPGSAYDSIILAFSPLDQPSRDQIRQVVALLPAVLFPGGQDRLCWLAKLHSDGTSVHLHVLVARVDLRTGLQFSLHGMGLRPLKELCRVLNRRYGWADPEDEFRGRLAWWSQDITGPGLPPGTGIHAHARALAIAAVLEGRVASQADMTQVLQSLGAVVSTGRYSITLDVTGVALHGPRATTTVKFSGRLYSKAFDRAEVLRSLAPAPLPAALTKRDTPLEDRRLAEELFARMLRDIKKRAEALAARYAVKPARARRSLVTHVAWESGQDAPLPEIDLRRRQPTTRGTQTLVSTPTSGALHETTSPAAHRIHAHGHRPVSTAAGPAASRAAPTADLAGLGQAMLESVRAWVRDTLAPRVLEVARRAVGAVLDNVLGAKDPGGRLDRLGSASGAPADSGHKDTDATIGHACQGRLDTGRNSDMNQDAQESTDVEERSPKVVGKRVRPG